MTANEFLTQLENAIGRYDLLTHPFYQAWTRGDLTREDLQYYASEYYHQVESFPQALAEFARRLPACELRRSVMDNLADELGGRDELSHAELWLTFAEGVGVKLPFPKCPRSAEIQRLISFFREVARHGLPEQALAAFYAYESQVPRISSIKKRTLRHIYGCDDTTCQYFEVHTKADVLHAEVWRKQLVKRLQSGNFSMESAIGSADAASGALWRALDAIEDACLERLAKRSSQWNPSEGAD